MKHDDQPTADTSGGLALREVFDLREWARVCSAHLWWVIIVTFAVVAGTAMVTFTATPYFRATQRILIERQSDKVLNVPEIYETGGGESDFYLTQYKLLESPAVAQAALDLLPVADRRWFARHGDPVEQFMRLCRVVPLRKSRLVDIHAEHPEPKIAEFMALALVRAFVANSDERRSRAASDATRRLREDARTLKAKMLDARRISQEYRAKHGILDISDRQSLAEFRLQSLNAELATIERELSDSDSRLTTAKQTLHQEDFTTTDLPEVLQNKVIAEFKLAYLDFSSKLSQLQQKYKPKHPRVVEMASKVAAVDAQLRREVTLVFGALQHENDRLRRHRDDVEGRIVRHNKVLQDQDAHFVRYQSLVDEAKSRQNTYEQVLERLQEVEVIEGYGVSNVHPVGAPRVSSHAVRPRPLAALCIALLAGLILSCMLAFVLDGLDNSIKSGHAAGRLLDLPILGTVPRVRGGHAPMSADERALDPASNVSEAFRSIRTRLLLSEPGRNLRSLVVTSTGAGEGKSLVALNIAAAFARAGHRVLLVDAEMRRPRLHDALDIHSPEGFSSVLVGDRPAEDVAFETRENNLYFMPCGVLPPNPLELLTIGLNLRVRRELGDLFDLVVFDAPPVGIVSDACVLATATDHVLFVVRTFTADRIRAQRAIDNLRATGARIAGLIVNHVDSKGERGRQLDFSYDAAYASVPVPTPPERRPDEDLTSVRIDDIDEAEVDHQIRQLGAELQDAISHLSRLDTTPEDR